MPEPDLLSYCLSKPGAWQDQPWEDDIVVKVGSKGFAGGKVLDLIGPETAQGPRIEEGAVLPAIHDTDIMAKANEVLGEAQKVVKQFQDKGTVQDAMGVVKSARSVLDHLDKTLISMHAMVEEDRAALKATLEHTQGFTARSDELLEKRSAAMERSLKSLDDSLVHLPSILINLEELSADLKKHPWRLIRKGDETPVALEHKHGATAAP